ncbi:MAG: hypothetical protein ACHQ50_02180 [Fimbriimonadales bacterium]
MLVFAAGWLLAAFDPSLALGYAGRPDMDAKGAAFQTRDARIQIDGRGFITSFVSRGAGKEYSPPGHASPLLSLHESGQPDGLLAFPTSASFRAKNSEIDLSYSNGAIARVKAAEKGRYFRFQLVSLANRGAVDSVVWGPIHTNISKVIGDLIGVARDGDWAIGMLGLDDNTIAGTPVGGDCYGMEYFIHSPDPKNHPLPPNLKEGQRFNIGGDGVSDVAFYSHPEEYFQMVFGSGARLEPEFGSTLAYHSRDRRKPDTFLFSLLPDFPGSRPRHQVTDPVDADFIGSAVALYACPDMDGLATIENILLAEGLPHVMMDGKWVRDPAGLKPDIAWWGPHDKLIEYADALGLKAVQDEGQGEYYANPTDHWQGPRVGFSAGKKLTYKEFTDDAARHGIKYGLHTLCLFLQPGHCTDVTPIPNEHLQTVLRTRLARGVSSTANQITVTDPSFLGEDGTWPMRDGSNTLRIGRELLTYAGISETAPYTLKGVKRGQCGTQAQPHQAGDELVKLQMNCYNGFVPDMDLMLGYADYYATVMAETGMEYVDFDGLESTLYQNHGYYGVRRFFRRLFDTFGRLTRGKAIRVMGSCVFAGGWEYMSVCNVGGDNNMFDPILNRWGIEGKDIRNGFGSSYFPPTFGIQSYRSDWSVYDAENLQAKSIGWDATYMLGLSQDTVERSGEKQAIFKALRVWEDARAKGVFTLALKKQLMDLSLKFHLERSGDRAFTLVPVREIRLRESAGSQPKEVSLMNSGEDQPLQFSLRVSGLVGGSVITLPGGRELLCDHRIEAGQFLICKGDRAYLADKFRKEIAGLTLTRPARLPKGYSKLGVRFTGNPAAPLPFDFTAWISGNSVRIGVHRQLGNGLQDLTSGKPLSAAHLAPITVRPVARDPDRVVLKARLACHRPAIDPAPVE